MALLSKKMVDTFIREIWNYERSRIKQERVALDLCFGLIKDGEQPVKKGEAHDKSAGSGRKVFKDR